MRYYRLVFFISMYAAYVSWKEKIFLRWKDGKVIIFCGKIENITFIIITEQHQCTNESYTTIFVTKVKWVNIYEVL